MNVKIKQPLSLFFSLFAAAMLSACGNLNTSFGSKNQELDGNVNVDNRPEAVIALALGGGASKGFAHIGAIRVLEENNIPIRIVTGTSAGAIVGSLYAAGFSSKALLDVANTLQKRDVIDFTISSEGFIKGEKLQNWINSRVMNLPIEKLQKKFAAVATEFDTGRMVVFDKGNTGQAVRASSSIPNVFKPTVIDGVTYVDGGLVAPVPVQAAHQEGANVVIAVDISAHPAHAQGGGFLGAFDQSISIMSLANLQKELEEADIVIRPEVQEMGTFGGFNQRENIIRLGEEAAIRALPAIRSLLQKYRGFDALDE